MGEAPDHVRDTATDVLGRPAGAGGGRLVRPLALIQPALGADLVEAREGPCALVAVLLAARVVPGGAARGGDRFRELVRRHVDERRETLRVQARRVTGIAARDAVDVRHVRDLDLRAIAARAPAVPRAVADVAGARRRVDEVHGVW